MIIKKFVKFTLPLGMIAVIVYLSHAILGRLLWNEYNPITTYISTLTAIGAPNRELLLIFTHIYNILMILFITGLLIKTFKKYKWSVKIGYTIMIIMHFVSFIGYILFPLTGEKIVMNFQNIMHIIITVIIVFATNASGYFLAFGYLKQEKKYILGKFIFIMAIIITITGIANAIFMLMKLNILGLSERFTIYSLQLMLFIISAYYTFNNKEKID